MTSPSTPSLVGLPVPGSYQLDPSRSGTTFTTRHLFGLGTVVGSMAVLDGQVTIAADPASSTVQATVSADSFQSSSAGRDEVVKSRGYLDVDSHPHLRYDSASLVANGQSWLVRGTLTVRGVAAPLELTVTDLSEAHDEVTVRATAVVDRYAHGLTKGRGLAARQVRVQLTAVAIRTPVTHDQQAQDGTVATPHLVRVAVPGVGVA